MLTQFTDGRAEIFLRGKEKVNIPFVFQSFSSHTISKNLSGLNTLKVEIDTGRREARIITVIRYFNSRLYF